MVGEAVEVNLVAVNASHSADSKTHAVAALAVEVAGGGRVIDLCTLDPGGLVGTAPSDDVAEVLTAMAAADVLVLVTPVYRATYSGILKVVLDQLPQDGLRGTACILAATGRSPAHELMLDTGMRSVVASLAGWTVPTTVYAVGEDFDEHGTPAPPLADALAQALAEAKQITS